MNTEYAHFKEMGNGYEEKIKELINIIRNKSYRQESLSLDSSIQELAIQEVLFLGKLRKMQEIVSTERFFLDDLRNGILEKVNDFLGDENLQPELRVEAGSRVYEKINKLLEQYLLRFTAERFKEELRRQWNSKLRLATHEWFMTALTRSVAGVFGCEAHNETEMVNLKSKGVLFIDLDGLKVLNDMSLGKYEAGDRALKKMAEVLSGKELKEWAAKMDIELIPAHHHGDEFLLGIVGGAKVDLVDNKKEFIGVDGKRKQGISIIKYIGEYISDKLKNVDIEEIKDILDFSNPEQLEKFSEFKNKLPHYLKNKFNESFVYQLNCSYGYAVLEDAFVRNIKDGFSFEESDFETIVYKLTGRGMIESAAEKLGISKMIGRRQRMNSSNSYQRILEMLYRYVREDRRLNGSQMEKELKKLLKEVKRVIAKQEQEVQRLNTNLNMAMEEIMNLHSQVEDLQDKLRRLQEQENSNGK